MFTQKDNGRHTDGKMNKNNLKKNNNTNFVMLVP